MRSDTTSTRPDRAASKTSGGTGGARTWEHVVVVQLAAWGPQHSTVRGSSGGGRGGRPYLAVTVGSCLTYVYDRDALHSHLSAWQEADRGNRAIRLPEVAAPLERSRNTGTDLAVICNVTAAQPYAVTTTTGSDGRPTTVVTVGAVSVHVHTTTALRSHLAAWTRAATAIGFLDDPA